MGQAKNRGSKLDRIQQSIQIKAERKPEYLICNECQAHVIDIQEMDTKGMHGITAAYAGICSCGKGSFAIIGNKVDVAQAAIALQQVFDNELKLGVQTISKKLD